MASIAFVPGSPSRPSLAKIDAVVSARLGPTRIRGNAQPACFNRQVAMYLAKHMGRRSTTQIGRFYNGRDHSTVCYGIQRIEALRESDPEVDGLLAELRYQILEDESVGPQPDQQGESTYKSSSSYKSSSRSRLDELADLIAERVCARLQSRYESKGEQD